MAALAPGANTSLSGTQCSWTLECGLNQAFGDYAGVALLPVNDKRQPQGEPALLQTERGWMSWEGDKDKISCQLKLGQLPSGCDHLLLVVYVFSAAGPISELRSLKLLIDQQIDYTLDIKENGEAAIVIGDFYLRNQQWKFRALSEGSAYGLAALGRRIGQNIDDAHPHRHANPPSNDSRRASGIATGTGFAVSPSHIMTCAHVIEDMQVIAISSFEGRYSAEPVVVDARNDIALLRVHGAPALKPVTFRDGSGCYLGESVVALGFPLAGFAGGGVQVTQGGVSGLFGVRNDASRLQFTAPIQPGSSGSPLFDSTGAVVGMVTSTIPDAQNMNFAVKAGLVLSFLDACHVDIDRKPTGRVFTTAELARAAQQSMWRIEASNP